MLEISPRKVAQVIFLSRKAPAAQDDLHAFIEGLNDDDKAQMTAIAWVGRGAFDAGDFDEALETAYGQATTPTADYLMGMPHLAEHLAAGLEALGIDPVEVEEDLD